MKLLVVAIIGFLAFKLFTSTRAIEEADPKDKLEDESFTDYEEVDNE